MISIGTALSKIWSLGLDAYSFDKLPLERRVRRWGLNSDNFNRLYAERRAGVKVVDLGCGSSARRAPVIEAVGAENYLGIDFDLRNKPDLVSDAARLPLADNSLQFVRAFSLFEHTYNYAAILGEIYRTLRPGGCVFIQTPFFLEFHGFPSDYFRFTRVAWQHILQDARLEVVDYEEWGKGFFINLAQVLESGSFGFIGARWYGLRFTLRLLSKIAWRLRRFDKHYQGLLYASVLIMGEKPRT